MYKYGIVVIGYKKEEGIKRLLDALSLADYDEQDVKLIISIDKSEDDKIIDIANEFQWNFGQKHVVTYAKRLGLREHVLRCGDYLNAYDLDAIAVFEDDTMPSRNFFNFMKAATEKYIEDENIAGVALHTYCRNFNTHIRKPDVKFAAREWFVPIMNDGDNCFIQYAQSWGQVWFKQQWNEFREWYDVQEGLESDQSIPRIVSDWPETSWLKYHIKYCIVKDKYFVYPYVSYATCFTEVGEHTNMQTDDYQAPLSNVQSKTFQLIDFDEKALKYDTFFENQNLYRYCNVDQADLLVDLYGEHVETDKRYILTKKKMDYHVIRSWGDKLVPHEMNLIYDLHGNDIFLYDSLNAGETIKFPENEFERDKIEIYFNILDRWMDMEERGKSLESYFLEKNWKHIAIYGYGKIGKHMYNRLKNSLVNVDYFIDQNTVISEKGVTIKNPADKLPLVDVIIITPVLEFEEISKHLRQNQDYQIVSAEVMFE